MSTGGAPSPAPRSGSIGPGAAGGMPQQQVNGASTPTTPAGGGGGGAAPTVMSQQNLNQIVSDKGVIPGSMS